MLAQKSKISDNALDLIHDKCNVLEKYVKFRKHELRMNVQLIKCVEWKSVKFLK